MSSRLSPKSEHDVSRARFAEGRQGVSRLLAKFEQNISAPHSAKFVSQDQVSPAPLKPALKPVPDEPRVSGVPQQVQLAGAEDQYHKKTSVKVEDVEVETTDGGTSPRSDSLLRRYVSLARIVIPFTVRRCLLTTLHSLGLMHHSHHIMRDSELILVIARGRLQGNWSASWIRVLTVLQLILVRPPIPVSHLIELSTHILLLFIPMISTIERHSPTRTVSPMTSQRSLANQWYSGLASE